MDADGNQSRLEALSISVRAQQTLKKFHREGKESRDEDRYREGELALAVLVHK